MPNLIQRMASRIASPFAQKPKQASEAARPKTKGYRPLPQMWFQQPRDLPPFTFETIRAMLLDGGIRLNLATRAAPIYGIQFAYKQNDAWVPGVQARNPAVGAWVQRQLETIWRNYLPYILRAQVWGWSAGEVTLKLSTANLLEIHELLPRFAGDCRMLERDGCRYGVRVQRVIGKGDVDLQYPYCWIHQHNAEDGEQYGQSVLLGAYDPWADKWFQGGALDVRKLFMRKDAYGGAKVGYPERDVFVEGQNAPVPARDVAMQIVQQAASGAVLTYPTTKDQNGGDEWVVERAQVSSNPQHILQFPKDLDDEIRIGMLIPDDVISNDGSGAWAGKRIPMAAFYASLDCWVTQILNDLRFTLDPIVMMNWGRAEEYEITHKPLAEQAMEQQSNAGPGQQQPQQQAPIARSYGRVAGGEGSYPENPYRMSLGMDPIEAVGKGVLDAGSLVKAAKMALRMGWSHHEGKLGGQGWKNDETGEIRYQDSMPSEHQVNETEPVEIDTTKYEGLAPEEIRKIVFRQAMDTLRKEPILNAETNETIRIGRIGIEKTLSHSSDIRVAMTIPHLPEILRVAKPIGSSEVTDPGSNIVRYRYFEATIQIDGGTAQTKLKIREMRDGNWYYDQHITGKPKK
jgi:hypothetical protein